MDFNNILNQILNAGQQLTQQNGNNFNPNNQTTNNSDLPFNLDILKGFGGGAAATGILSMLLGNNGFGKGILKLGSVAAIGSMAYSAWKNYQATQQATTHETNFLTPEARTPEQSQNASQLMLKAMIAAAAADGEIDNNESQALISQIGSENPDIQNWLQQQLQNPPSIQSIAAEVGSDISLATQIYLASRIVCGDLNRQEIIYLHDLATALNLDQSLVEKLEAEAGF